MVPSPLIANGAVRFRTFSPLAVRARTRASASRTVRPLRMRSRHGPHGVAVPFSVQRLTYA